MQNPEKYFSGKIIKGTEPHCSYHGHAIELLGYGIDVEKMHESLKGLYHSPDESQQIWLERFCAKCLEKGVKLSPGIVASWDRKTCTWASEHVLNDIKKYPENRKIITDDESWNSSLQLWRNCVTNKNNPLYIDESEFLPSAETIYKAIKKSGGLVFIPHIFAYGEDSIPILENLVKEFQIDGIECFYNSFTPEQTEYLLDFCKKHNLLVSAGSDYHGANRPHIKLGVTDARLKDLTGWLETVINQQEGKKYGQTTIRKNSIQVDGVRNLRRDALHGHGGDVRNNSNR